MITQQINLRTAKAVVIAKTKYQIKKVSEMEFIVKSQSKPDKQYAVGNLNGKWSCSCPDHTYRGAVCKHMMAVQIHIEERAKNTSR